SPTEGDGARRTGVGTGNDREQGGTMKVLISGGSSGLGAATVREVLAAGGTPLVLDREPPASGVDGRVDYVCADLADTPAAESAVRARAERARVPVAWFACAGSAIPAA